MTTLASKLKVAILGSGNIGKDLLVKVMRSSVLECTVFIGRNLNSSGVQKAFELGVNVSADSINYIVKKIQTYVTGYELILGSIIENYRNEVMVKVRGQVTTFLNMLAKVNIIISDPTLRDGNHAVRHQISAEQIELYCKAVAIYNTKS